MSVPAPAAVREPRPALATRPAVEGTDASFDTRWTAWIERGRQRDLAMNRRLRIALLAVAVICVLVGIAFGIAGTR